MPINLQGSSVKLMCGDHKIAKLYCENNVIYSSGNTVTYCIDSGVSYQEEVDEGTSCLSPKTFAPEKSGWEFVGWRQDAAANGNVLSSLAMGDAPITLYAVFKQTITLSYNGNSATGGSTAAQTGARYYNNGTVANPSFTLRSNGFTRTSYTFSKWALGSTGGTQYAAGASVTLAASTTMYAVWVAVAAPFTLALDASGWSGPTVIQGSFGWGPFVGEYMGGMRVFGNPSASGSKAKAWKTINTKGLPKADIKVPTNVLPYGSVSIGNNTITLPNSINFGTVTLSIDPSQTLQTLIVTLDVGSVVGQVVDIPITSIYFHS